MKILASWLVVRPLNTHIIYQVGQNYIIHPARVQQVQMMRQALTAINSYWNEVQENGS